MQETRADEQDLPKVRPLAPVEGSLVAHYQPLEYEEHLLERALAAYHQAVGEERSA